MEQWQASMQMAHKSGSSFFIIARDNGSVTKVYNPTEKLDDPNFEGFVLKLFCFKLGYLTAVNG